MSPHTAGEMSEEKVDEEQPSISAVEVFSAQTEKDWLYWTAPTLNVDSNINVN